MLPLHTRSCSPAKPSITLAIALCFLCVVTGAGCDEVAKPDALACEPLSTNGGDSTVPAPALELPPAVGQPFFQGTMFDVGEVGFILAEDATFIREAANALDVWP